jgi:hypothetical protein
MSDATDGASSVRETETRSVCCAVVSWDTIYPLTFYAPARHFYGVFLSSSLNALRTPNVTVVSYSCHNMDDHRRGRS